MAHQTAWYIPQRVILVHLSGDLTLEEVADMIEEIYQHMEQGTSLIHLIIDVTDLKHYPIQVRQVGQMVRRDQFERLGWALLVGGNSLQRFVGNVVTQFNPGRFHSYDTLELALRFLTKHDTSLNLDVNR